MAEVADVTIARIGAQGDGVADTAAGPVYVPLALPGERWRVAAGAAPLLLEGGAERATPPCRHFGACGGCVAQHMPPAVYSRWKEGVVAQALRHRGIDGGVAPLRRIGLHSRRRAQFGVTRQDGRIVLGFREEGQHRLVDMTECVILEPEIVTALPRLRALADMTLPAAAPGCRLIVTKLDHGLDVAFDCSGKTLSADMLQQVAGMARTAGIVRLAIGGDVVMSAGPPTLTLNGVALEPPPGLFLQAAAEAEDVMTELILAALPKAKTVADLFCGAGTFTFALARRARVTAVDGDRRALATLEAAAKRAQGLKPITAKVRDLFREPLTQRELDGFDAVVLDPPRAGAQAQCERLARSKVRTVVAVSCNPATLARDARILLDGGYRLAAVTPIDQFVYSAHIEAVAVFHR